MISITRTTDVHALATIARATFLQTYAHMIPWPDLSAHLDHKNSPEAYAAELDAGSVAWLACLPDTDVPVGFALLTAPDLPIETRPDDIELKRIYLLHRFHGLGTGKHLYDAVETEARAQGKSRLLLGVYTENPTIAWYRRQGFADVGTRSFRVGTRDFHDLILGKSLT